jgi:hypothetical protein
LYNFSQNLFKYVNVEWFSLKIIPGKALKVWEKVFLKWLLFRSYSRFCGMRKTEEIYCLDTLKIILVQFENLLFTCYHYISFICLEEIMSQQVPFPGHFN